MPFNRDTRANRFRWCESCESPMSDCGLFAGANLSAEERREYQPVRGMPGWYRVNKIAARDASLCEICFGIFNSTDETETTT
jgi:hypothetical protein